LEKREFPPVSGIGLGNDDEGAVPPGKIVEAGGCEGAPT
jgi:hypothetical protein